jgi:tetratricopeptide (TPR) repeat protein
VQIAWNEHKTLIRGAVCILIAAVTARAEWIASRTPRLELLTDAGEKSASRVLDRMATIRQVLGEEEGTQRALRIFVFASEREFRLYTEGTATGGFYQSGPERDYIVLPAGAAFSRTVAHEYVHRILNRGAPRYPRWLDEGLAEFYSTVEVRAGKALIGLPVETHLAILARGRELTSQELERAVSSTYLNERELAGIFYAQSWALVHMLKLGQGWREKTPAFFAMLASGDEPSAAFRAAFGRTLQDAIQELPGYLMHLRAARVEASAKVREEALPVQRLDTISATLVRADLALHTEKFDLARRLFEDAARSHVDSPEAEAGLGTLAMAQDRRAEAQQHLQRAIELHATGGEMFFELAMLKREEDSTRGEVDPLLERAIAADPSYAEAHLLLGQIQTDRGDYSHAIPHLEAAAAILPRQSDIWHALAYAQMKAGMKDAARESAARAVATARSVDTDRMARALLESLE